MEILKKIFSKEMSNLNYNLNKYSSNKSKVIEEFADFQKTIEDCKIQLMGYSANWADNIEEFWKGKSYIRPKKDCHITHMVAFYDPFTNHFYPCNCIPHRKLPFESEQEEKEWYFEHGHEYCKGCEPLNAYCADFPEKMEENIFNF